MIRQVVVAYMVDCDVCGITADVIELTEGDAETAAIAGGWYMPEPGADEITRCPDCVGVDEGDLDEDVERVVVWKRWDVRSLGLTNVHDPAVCAHRMCVIHSPTRHHMSRWPIVWRWDRGIVERLCHHGVGHPDPDQLAYWDEREALGPASPGYAAAMAAHGCCGCCGEPATIDRWPVDTDQQRRRS